jgi:hypothetical protein
MYETLKQDVPHPNSMNSSGCAEAPIEKRLTTKAPYYKPSGGDEPILAATLSRYAMRVLDLITGKAYSLNEIPMVRYDKAQTITTAQKGIVQTTIGADCFDGTPVEHMAEIAGSPAEGTSGTGDTEITWTEREDGLREAGRVVNFLDPGTDGCTASVTVDDGVVNVSLGSTIGDQATATLDNGTVVTLTGAGSAGNDFSVDVAVPTVTVPMVEADTPQPSQSLDVSFNDGTDTIEVLLATDAGTCGTMVVTENSGAAGEITVSQKAAYAGEWGNGNCEITILYPTEPSAPLSVLVVAMYDIRIFVTLPSDSDGDVIPVYSEDLVSAINLELIAAGVGDVVEATTMQAAVAQVETATADGIITPGTAQVETATAAGTITSGTKQVETATAVGTITGDGDATVTVTGALVGNSPKAIDFAVLTGDTASDWATKCRTALNVADITTNYTVGGSGADITLTAKVEAADDTNLNIALANKTCTGITEDATSTDTTPGVSPGTAKVTVTGALVDGSPKQFDVAVATGDTAATWAGKVRTALGVAAITDNYTVGGSDETITLTAKVEAANDANLNIALENGTCTGITDDTSSANTTPGVEPGDGDATVTITSALVTGSPLDVAVAVAAGDTAATWAGKVRTELDATDAVTDHYTVGGSSATITLTAKVKAVNDTTLNIALDNDTCTGITPAATSANTTPGEAYLFDTAKAKILMDSGVDPSPDVVGNLYSTVEAAIEALDEVSTATGATAGNVTVEENVSFTGGGANYVADSTAVEIVAAVVALGETCPLLAAGEGTGKPDFANDVVTWSELGSDITPEVIGTTATLGRLATDGTDVWAAIKPSDGTADSVWKQLT